MLEFQIAAKYAVLHYGVQSLFKYAEKLIRVILTLKEAIDESQQLFRTVIC